MNKRDLKKHVSPKGTDYYLMRLGLLEKQPLDRRARRELTDDNLPKQLHYDQITGGWFTIEDREVSTDEAELFLQTRRTRADVLRTNALIAGVVIAAVYLGQIATVVG
ncbi:MAG: hypothetical protein EA340_11030 [Nitriliruptor sp.]|nr:MAG: hypothetical protein EA340_11030 [Nitriliruptor sp.]